ncbi:MAG TPA: glucans biosynthesis glucosyltransferase MdoH, partial [Burkholderiaceae bacterium]|nr:glucans biosynthesis glucosyltransferase MdoH [Burkholderiaceae bacterium]
MTPRPWTGLWRGIALAILQLLLGRVPADRGSQQPWEQAAHRRRHALLAFVFGATGLAVFVAWGATAAEPLEWRTIYLTLFALLFAWVCAGFATAAMGFLVLLRGDRHALSAPVDPTIDPVARAAVAMTICNEDVATVFAGLRATCESLLATGRQSLFDVFVLSDTRDGALRAVEIQAWETLASQFEVHGLRVHYRWRRRRAHRKAGNIADFCRRWGRNYRYMVVLDADSVMTGESLVAMVALMEANPRAGIVQTAPRACGHDTFHARAQSFLGRVTGALFTRGLAYWQLGESHYWGHNAIIRVEPFMRHCALARLPGREGSAAEILSHDFVEAALMRRAGFEVWLAPDIEGSFEQPPAHLLDELQRDRRWCHGNLLNARLIAEPGLSSVHRAMFATGLLSYVASPLWLAFVVLGFLKGVQFGADRTAPLWWAVLVMLLLPRALGVMLVLARREQAAFGGLFGLVSGATLEALLSAFQAPIRMAAHTLFVVASLTGLKLEWKSPARAASALGWREAAARLRWLSLPLGTVGVVAIPHTHGGSTSASMPLLLPLVFAVPLV